MLIRWLWCVARNVNFWCRVLQLHCTLKDGLLHHWKLKKMRHFLIRHCRDYFNRAWWVEKVQYLNNRDCYRLPCCCCYAHKICLDFKQMSKKILWHRSSKLGSCFFVCNILRKPLRGPVTVDMPFITHFTRSAPSQGRPEDGQETAPPLVLVLLVGLGCSSMKGAVVACENATGLW